MLTFMGRSHFSRRRQVLAVVAALCLHAATAVAQTAAPSGFTVFLRSVPIGREQIDVEHTANGWTISSTGQFNAPIDIVFQRVRARYDNEWRPLELSVDATVRGAASLLTTTVDKTSAHSTVTRLNGTPSEANETIDPQAVFLPNPFVAPYEAVAARLRTAAAGSALSMFQPGGGSFVAEVGASEVERIKTPDRLIEARRTALTFKLPNVPPLPVIVWGDENGRLLRVSIPSQSLEYAREDIASVSTRVVTMARPNDEDVLIPSIGFSLSGTVSKPVNSPAGSKLPAVVLVSGTTAIDRDLVVAGVSIFGRLSNALADAGYLVLRYDPRGTGQSGGRTESARLADYAEDLKAAIKLMADRRDVDKKRVAVVGYGEGGWIAMLGAAKNDRVSALALVNTAGSNGQDLNMAQMERGLARSSRTAEQKQTTIDLQRKIQQAVLTGSGWEAPGITPQMRRQADTPYFQSFLQFDPSRVMRDVKQPILIVQAALDTETLPEQAEKLDALAKARKNAPPSKVVTLAGLNHLLVPAHTGDTDEYATLADRTVSADATGAIVSWLGETGQARGR